MRIWTGLTGVAGDRDLGRVIGNDLVRQLAQRFRQEVVRTDELWRSTRAGRAVATLRLVPLWGNVVVVARRH